MDWKKEAPANALQTGRPSLRILVPHGVTMEDVQRPFWWRHNVAAARSGLTYGEAGWNKIDVIAEDGSWECMLRVVSVDQLGHVHTRLLSSWADSKKQLPKVPEGYEIEYIREGWRVIKAGGEILAERRTTERDAIEAAIKDAA